MRDENFYGIHFKKSKFSSYFIVYTSMRVSDVIRNVTKQNMNVMTSTLSAYHANRWRDKKQKVSANQNNFDTKLFLTF